MTNDNPDHRLLSKRVSWITSLCFTAVFSGFYPVRAGAATNSARTCQAADAHGFATCVAQATSGTIDHIVVSGMIACGAATPCQYTLSGINRAFSIGGNVAGAGFSRTADSRAAFGLHIDKSTGPITVSGLQFSMGKSAAQGKPGALWTDPACPTAASCPEEAIAITNSGNVLVDQVEIDDAKTFGIAIVASSNITIRRSTFARSDLHGIWVLQTPASSGLHIENNKFVDNRSNAAMLSAAPPDANDPLGSNTVTGNLFDHNHNAAVYHVCGSSGHDPCAGGQLDIVPQSDSFIIADNEFERGILDEDPTLAQSYRVAGVEIAPTNVKNITIRHNYFHDLTAGAISIDSAAVAPQVSVISNLFLRTGARDPDITYPTAVARNIGNCEGAQAHCSWVRPTGAFSVGACTSNGALTCGVSIAWRSESTPEPLSVITNGNQLLEKSRNKGSVFVPWITATPTRFDLYATVTLLDTIQIATH
jgi:hypothetical protein